MCHHGLAPRASSSSPQLSFVTMRMAGPPPRPSLTHMGTALSAKDVANRDDSGRTFDLRRATGFVVTDRQGQFVGKVECPMYGSSPDRPDALCVRAGLLSLHRLLVPAEAIDDVDPERGAIRLSISRERVRAFL